MIKYRKTYGVRVKRMKTNRKKTEGMRSRSAKKARRRRRRIFRQERFGIMRMRNKTEDAANTVRQSKPSGG